MVRINQSYLRTAVSLLPSSALFQTITRPRHGVRADRTRAAAWLGDRAGQGLALPGWHRRPGGHRARDAERGEGEVVELPAQCAHIAFSCSCFIMSMPTSGSMIVLTLVLCLVHWRCEAPGNENNRQGEGKSCHKRPRPPSAAAAGTRTGTGGRDRRSPPAGTSSSCVTDRNFAGTSLAGREGSMLRPQFRHNA